MKKLEDVVDRADRFLAHHQKLLQFIEVGVLLVFEVGQIDALAAFLVRPSIVVSIDALSQLILEDHEVLLRHVELSFIFAVNRWHNQAKSYLVIDVLENELGKVRLYCRGVRDWVRRRPPLLILLPEQDRVVQHVAQEQLERREGEG